jgi:mannose-6-phosphate isomerase-like protein (cupin superfamily)
MIKLSGFEEFIHSDLVYQQKIISVIDENSRQIVLNNLAELYSYTSCTIKLEQMEKYNKQIFDYCHFLSANHNHYGPVTCHAFRAFRQSMSFGLHTDPDDVILYCIHGKKKMVVDGNEYILKPHDTLFIPANTPHEAINDDESLMLSFGLEKFYVEKLNYELDVLPKDNRNMQSEL